jgi:hypothetical protein
MELFRNIFKGGLIIIIMKRGLVKKRKSKQEFYLKWGIFGLKISLVVVLLILSVLLYILFLETRDLYEVCNVLFRFPNLSGFLFVYAGIILFIVVPFFAGILIGRKMEKRK